ncbi:MAG: hypothetical protein KAZ87_09075 [Spirochaetes bacterium]|nr:hypothetical protein [Spirochaetota bacterium]
MKYKSIQWWFIAISYYFIIPFNKLYYKIHGYPQDKLSIANMVIDDAYNKQIYYDLLINKYPEFVWCEKYIDEKDSFIVPDEIRIIGTAKRTSFSAVWTYNGNIDQLKKLIMVTPVLTTIYIGKKRKMHSVLVIGFNEKESKIIIHDPLGDVNSNYKIWYGGFVKLSIDKYESISCGHPFTFIIWSPKKITKSIIRIVDNVKYYTYP